MTSRDGEDRPTDGPDDEDTVLRPSADVPGPEVVGRSSVGRSIVPDHDPIQRFDRRPRFGPPPFDPPSPPAPSPSPAPPALPPGIDATTGPRRRGLLIPSIAFGCALLLLLGIGGGFTALWLTGRDRGPGPGTGAGPSTSRTGTEPGMWEPLAPDQVPSGDAEELRQVLSRNPLLVTRLAEPAGCTLPTTGGGMIPAEQLPAFLEAGADCLAVTWTRGLAAEGIDLEAPRIVVFATDSPPQGSACAAERFTGDAPVVCHDDATLYWPAEWDAGFSNASAAEAPSLYLWHLSYSYTLFALAAADLDGYYGALLLALADSPEQAEEAQRRYTLQLSCLASAAAFQLPDGFRPAQRVESFVTSVEAQSAPLSAGEPSQASRAAWVATGQKSRGDLGRCAIWTVPAAEVA